MACRRERKSSCSSWLVEERDADRFIAARIRGARDVDLVEIRDGVRAAAEAVLGVARDLRLLLLQVTSYKRQVTSYKRQVTSYSRFW